jgi:restriction system protein
MPQSLGPPITPAPRPPTYTEIAHAVRLLDGEAAKRVRDMMNAIFELANSPGEPVEWTDPDRWINERLAGDVRRLARKVWDGSGKTLNPRYLYAHHKIINRLKLLELVDGAYRCAERGRQFLAGDKAILAELMELRVSDRRGSRSSDTQSEH